MTSRELWDARRENGPTLITDGSTAGTPFGDYVPVTYLGTGRRGRLRYSTLRARYDFVGLRDDAQWTRRG